MHFARHCERELAIVGGDALRRPLYLIKRLRVDRRREERRGEIRAEQGAFFGFIHAAQMLVMGITIFLFVDEYTLASCHVKGSS